MSIIFDPGEHLKKLILFLVLGVLNQPAYAGECVKIHKLNSIELEQYVTFEVGKIEIIEAFKGEYDQESEKCKTILTKGERFLGGVPHPYLHITAYRPSKLQGKGVCLFDIYSYEMAIESKVVKLSPTKSCSLRSETCTLKTQADLDLCLTFELDFPREYVYLITSNLENARRIVQDRSGVAEERLRLPQVSEYMEGNERFFLYRFIVAGEPGSAFSSEGGISPQFVKINMLGEAEYIEENDSL